MLSFDYKLWAVILVSLMLLLLRKRPWSLHGFLFRFGSSLRSFLWNNREHRRQNNDLPCLPDPDALIHFDMENAMTRNYLYANKPLRHPYFQTMAHQRMHINHWIEIDKDLPWYLSEKARVIKEQGKHVIDSLPENDEACAELLEVLVDWLPKRYPTLFEQLGSPGEGIWNKVTDEMLLGLKQKRGIEALMVISKLVQDDFLMAREREDGHVYCVGGLVAFPGSYLLSEKLNQSMSETHHSVPFFNKRLLVSVERTLKRFEPDEPFERTSWAIVDDRKLFWHDIASLSLGETVPDQLDPKDLFLRMDHQTFRKLPRTRAIIFGVHPILKRLEDLADSPLVPALLAEIHEHSDQNLLEYKHTATYHSKMVPYLRELTQRQVDKGLIRGDEHVGEFRNLGGIVTESEGLS